MADKFNDVDLLLGGLFKPNSLRDLFDRKLAELELATTATLDILGISYRTLHGILDGTQKTVDYTNLIKLSAFLQIPKEDIIKLYLEALEKNHSVITITPDKINFIKENFDLAVLKKSGFIDSITDFAQIEQQLVKRLGLRSIFEYRKPPIDVAFSSGLFNPKNQLTRAFWIQSAITCFREIDNPYAYDREGLIKFFPQIRWYSTNVKNGLLEVIRSLYRLGITVIYQPPLATLKLRGATFAVDDKPCIVLTNYWGYYSTLWFALIHELYHVLFDFDEIQENRYHLTDDSNDELSVLQREKMADDFAREYLFSLEKMNVVRKFIDDKSFIESYAHENHIHPSMIYVFHAFHFSKSDRNAWPRARTNTPDINLTIKNFDLPWSEANSIEEILKQRRETIYS